MTKSTDNAVECWAGQNPPTLPPLDSNQEGPAGTIRGTAPRKVRIVNYHNAEFFEIPWLRRLLRDKEITVVRDTSQTTVIPDSIVISTRLNELRPNLLQQIGKTSGVVLYHISDEWYTAPLRTYRFFVHVIRNYFHTGLSCPDVSQFPLGACYDLAESTTFLPATRRKFVWSFAGKLIATRGSLVESLRCLGPNHVHLTQGVRRPATPLNPDHYLATLKDSVFVPCAMGNVNLESFRVYEALDCGAIPIVETRPWLDYFTRLLGPHPLPSVCHWSEAVSLMQTLLLDRSKLEARQAEIQRWWTQFQARLAEEFTMILSLTRGKTARVSFKEPPPGPFRGALEMLKHHNGTALLARTRLTLNRLVRRLG